MNDNNRLAPTSWNCKYYIVFAPKYRRMSIYGESKADIGKILRQLCQQKGIEIIEAELCLDHIHILINISPKYRYLEMDGLAGKIHYAQFLHDGSEVLYTERNSGHFSQEGWEKKETRVYFQLPTVKPPVISPVIEVFLK